MSITTLIKTAFSDVFRDESWQEFSAGKLMSPDFKKDMIFGDEVNVDFDGMVTITPYTGGDLNPANAEYVTKTVVKVKINQGMAVQFKLDKQKVRQIENASTNEEKVRLAKQYADDTKQQFAQVVNKAVCGQYVRAGNVISNSGSAITLSKTNVIDIFAKAQALLRLGDGKGHTAWKDGEMLAIVPPYMQAFMSTQNLLQYSDKMAETYKNGYIGHFMGFDVVVDANVAKDGSSYEYPLFGRSKKTIAGGIQQELELQSDVPVGGFDTVYWGAGVFGVKLPLSYLMVTAKLSINFAIGA